MKEKAYKAESEVNGDLRAHLSDANDYKNKSEENFIPQKRDRSASNENFVLPPLPSIDDHGDLQNLGNLDFNLDNFKSNENIDKIKTEEEEDFSNLANQSDKEELDINMMQMGINFG